MSLDTPASNLPYTHRLLVADSAASTGLTVTLQNQSPNRFNGTMPVCETSINGAPYAIDPYCTLKSYNMYNTTCYCSYPTNPGSIQFAAMVVTSPTSQPTPAFSTATPTTSVRHLLQHDAHERLLHCQRLRCVRHARDVGLFFGCHSRVSLCVPDF